MEIGIICSYLVEKKYLNSYDTDHKMSGGHYVMAYAAVVSVSVNIWFLSIIGQNAWVD
jgi:hypothetical protein